MILINSSPKNALKIFQPFLPISVPIGIGCLLAVAEKEKIKATFIDEQVEENILCKVKQYIKEIEKPYIFGFSVLTAALKSSINLSKQIKELYPDSIIVFGGVHPTALPEEILAYNHIDLVVRGEGEKSLIELYRCIKEGKDFTHIDNLSYRRNGQTIINQGIYILDDSDSNLPFPYHLFLSNKYDLGFIVSSRGCPYRCIFCSNRVTTGRKYRYRSSEIISNEIDMLYKVYGKRSITFLDDNFLVNRERVYSLIEEIKKRELDKKISFSFQARGDNVDHRFLQDLYNANFRNIFFGLETTSEELMKTIKKGETVEQCSEAVRIAKGIGFYVNATFIYGLPGDTYKIRMDCVRLSKELQLDMVRYNNATPYPGTELYEIAKRENRLNVQGLYENFNSVSVFIENPFNKIPFSYVPVGSTEDEIRRDLLFSYFSFYLDFSRLKQIFERPDLSSGWFNAGEHIKESLKKVPGMIILGFMLLIKFAQLFHYTVINKKTSISFKHFLRIFDGFFRRT